MLGISLVTLAGAGVFFLFVALGFAIGRYDQGVLTPTASKELAP